MKRFVAWLMLLVFWVCAAALAEPVTLGELAFDPAATRVDLGARRVTMEELCGLLDQLPEVRQVDMFATPVYRKQIDLLTDRYPHITFGWTICFAGHTVRTDATQFSTLHYSKDRVHGDADLSLLRYCTRLRALDIGHNACTDLSFTEAMPELRVLIVAVNRLMDIAPIARLQKLEYLELFSNHISDISPLADLPHLMDLNLSFNDIEDLSPLYEMKHLKRLWLYNSRNRNKYTPLDEDALTMLRAALPDTQIDTTHNPTAGGWREHPHFEVIHAMFRGDGYIPFADSFAEPQAASPTDLQEDGPAV